MEYVSARKDILGIAARKVESRKEVSDLFGMFGMLRLRTFLFKETLIMQIREHGWIAWLYF